MRQDFATGNAQPPRIVVVNEHQAVDIAGAQTHNTSTGASALTHITTGDDDTADGFSALQFNASGIRNTAVGSLTLKNKTDEPHTFSVVNKSDLPRTLNKVGDCGSPGTICDKLFSAHQPDPDGNPTKPVVDVGPPGPPLTPYGTP